AEPVRQAALRFLETGAAPVRPAKRGDQQQVVVDPAWPLPVPDYLWDLMRPDAGRAARPHYEVLLDMAIAAKKPDDVLHWYDKIGGPKRGSRLGGWHAGHDYADRVAAAVAATHPERALDIYRRHLQKRLGPADPRSYEAAGFYL